MPAEAYEQWSPRQGALDESAQRGWIVINASTLSEALRAPGGTGSAGVAQRGNTYPDNSDLVASAPNGRSLGPMTWEVTVEYSSSVGKLPSASDPNPINRPPRFSWERQEESVQTDANLDGHALQNSAGDAFDPAPTIEIVTRILTVKRFERFYNLGLADSLENTVNSDAVVLPLTGGRSVAAGYMRCLGYIPIQDYDRRTTAIEMAYTFAVRAYKWEWRFLDQGFRAMGLDPNDGDKPKPYELFDAENNQVSREVRLDGYGRPFKAGSYKLGTANRTLAGAASPEGAEIEQLKLAVFLKWKKFPKISYASLRIF